ncbi:N-acetyltransferase [Sphingomonas koreensis]
MAPNEQIEIVDVNGQAAKHRFVEVQFRLNAHDPAWVPPLKVDVKALISPNRNPWFRHAKASLFIARQGGRDIGRISAQIDALWLNLPADRGGGARCGNWGMLEAENASIAAALIGHAENWLLLHGMTRAVGPLSLSIWDEPGLLVRGFDHSPTVMMGHHRPEYGSWVEAAGYSKIRDLHTYDLDITRVLPPLVQRIVEAGERNYRIRVRRVEKARFSAEATTILDILNDAWASNWGIVPFTDAEIAHAGKKLKPIIFEDLVRIAEVDGEAVAFMMALPNLNEMLKDLEGRLFPTGFFKLLWRLNGGLSGQPSVNTMRVPLMGVKKRLQATRMATQLAFMMIEYIRRDAVEKFGATRAEVGWIAEDNGGMVSMVEMLGSRINRTYRVYGKELAQCVRA